MYWLWRLSCLYFLFCFYVLSWIIRLIFLDFFMYLILNRFLIFNILIFWILIRCFIILGVLFISVFLEIFWILIVLLVIRMCFFFISFKVVLFFLILFFLSIKIFLLYIFISVLWWVIFGVSLCVKKVFKFVMNFVVIFWVWRRGILYFLENFKNFLKGFWFEVIIIYGIFCWKSFLIVFFCCDGVMVFKYVILEILIIWIFCLLKYLKNFISCKVGLFKFIFFIFFFLILLIFVKYFKLSFFIILLIVV